MSSILEKLLAQDEAKPQQEELLYPPIFIYLLMSSLSLLIPVADLFLYSIWLRWSTVERDKTRIRDSRVRHAPFALRSLYFGTTWTIENYTGITEFMWKFASIGIKGILVALAWPFWLFPIVIGSIIYVFITILISIFKCLFFGSTPHSQTHQCDSLTESEEEEDALEAIDKTVAEVLKGEHSDEEDK